MHVLQFRAPTTKQCKLPYIDNQPHAARICSHHRTLRHAALAMCPPAGAGAPAPPPPCIYDTSASWAANLAAGPRYDAPLPPPAAAAVTRGDDRLSRPQGALRCAWTDAAADADCCLLRQLLARPKSVPTARHCHARHRHTTTQLASRLGVPAGPLLDSRWTGLASALGYDLITYKTIRSAASTGHSPPNVLYLRQLGSDGDDGGPLLVHARGCWVHVLGVCMGVRLNQGVALARRRATPACLLSRCRRRQRARIRRRQRPARHARLLPAVQLQTPKQPRLQAGAAAAGRHHHHHQQQPLRGWPSPTALACPAWGGSIC